MKSFFRSVFGGPSAPVDEDLEERVKLFNSHIDKLRRVKLALQLYADAVDAVSKAECLLAEAFSDYYKTSMSPADVDDALRPPCHAVAESFRSIMTERFSISRASINNIVTNRCIKPVTAILAKVVPIQEKIKMRKTLMADHDSSMSSLQRERDAGKPQDDPSVQRHSIKLDEVSINLGRVVSSVDSSLDDFRQARPFMLAHEMAAAIGCIYYDATSTITMIGKLLPALPQVASTLCVLNALGAQKKRPSALADRTTTETLRVVQAQIARVSVMGGRYGGYGLTTSSAESTQAGPLQTREALNSSAVSALPETEEEDDRSRELLDLSLLQEDEAQQQPASESQSPRRTTHPTRPFSTRVSSTSSVDATPSVPTIVSTLLPGVSEVGDGADVTNDSSDDEAVQEDQRLHSLNESVGKRSSLVAIKNLGRVREQIELKQKGLVEPSVHPGPPKPPKPDA